MAKGYALMTNEMKLLLAFIEASGYEVEEVPTKGSVIARDAFIAAGCTFDPELKYDYKVTKKVELINRYDDPTLYTELDGHRTETRAFWSGKLGMDVDGLAGFEITK